MSCPLCKKRHPFTLDQALAELRRTPRRLETLAGTLTPRRSRKSPAPGKWSVAQILCHLADCELVYGMRYRKLLAEPGSELVAFDQDAWADGLHYDKESAGDALARFTSLRQGHLKLFMRLRKAAWRRTGRHPEYGKLTLQQLVVHLAAHDRNHTAQIERFCG